MIWGEVHNHLRGRVAFFRLDPDQSKNPGSGFGFINVIDEDGQPVPGADDFWFHAYSGSLVDASHIPGKVKWIRRAERGGPLRMPIKGDVVIFMQDPNGRGEKPVASPWTYESVYTFHDTMATFQNHRLVDAAGNVIWAGEFSSKHDTVHLYHGARKPPEDVTGMTLQRSRRDDPEHYFQAMYEHNYWEVVPDTQTILERIRSAKIMI